MHDMWTERKGKSKRERTAGSGGGERGNVQEYKVQYIVGRSGMHKKQKKENPKGGLQRQTNSDTRNSVQYSPQTQCPKQEEHRGNQWQYITAVWGKQGEVGGMVCLAPRTERIRGTELKEKKKRRVREFPNRLPSAASSSATGMDKQLQLQLPR